MGKKIICNIVGLMVLVLILMLANCSQKTMVSGGTGFYEKLPEERAAKTSNSYEAPVKSENLNRSQMISYTVLLNLTVEDPEEAQKHILEHIKNSNGFVVEENIIRGTHYSITTRIPSNNLDSFVDNIAMLGKEVHKRKVGEDITDQYRDDVVMLESLKKIRDRYLALLEEAGVVNEMLVIEKELERVNREIEILTGRIKHAEAKVAYSSVTVRFEKEAEAAEQKKSMPGPLGWVFVGLYHGVKWLFVWN